MIQEEEIVVTPYNEQEEELLALEGIAYGENLLTT